MKFYRVCHSKDRSFTDNHVWHHVGPYGYCPDRDDDGVVEADADSLMRMCSEHNWDGLHIGMREDLGLTWEECRPYLCGFTSLEALGRWFAGYFGPLERLGFVVRVFDVSEAATRLGSQQAGCLASVVESSPCEVIPWEFVPEFEDA